MTATLKALAIAALAAVVVVSLPIRAVAADQAVSLPYSQPDKDGNSWMVQYYGYLQQQGNMPVYSNAAVLTVNGMSNNGRMQRTAKLDGKTGELLLENLPMGNLTVTRRFLFNKDDGYVRIIDVFHNAQGRDQQAQVVVNANANYGIQSGQMVADPKKKGQNDAFVGLTQANGKAIVEMFNGAGAKQPINIDYQQGNSQVTATTTLTVPANKDVAIMHVHAVANSVADGQDFVKKFKDKSLKDLPANIRKAIVNFSSSAGMQGDFEILRGELSDVVEMRTGDQFRGTLKDPTFKIATFYGPVELPADKVISIISQGAVRSRQLIFTSDGDVIGGTLEHDKLALDLSDGQSMQIPVAQIARVGYHKRSDEADEMVLDKPYVLMRTGERISIKMPTDPITVHTRFGPMKLKPDTLNAIVLQNEEHAIHEVHMSDGTRLAALVDSVVFQAQLAYSDQTIKFPLSSAARIQFHPDPTEAEENAPQLKLSNDEVMVGTLSGKIKLDTGFSMLNLDAEGIRSLARVKDSPQDVQVTLWDETSFRGQLQEPEITCTTKGGLEIKVPIALLEEYLQPMPKPGNAMVGTIKELVKQLNADEWAVRQKAQEKLVTMGGAAAGILKEMRPTQPEEAQRAIDQVLGAMEKKAK